MRDSVLCPFAKMNSFDSSPILSTYFFRIRKFLFCSNFFGINCRLCLNTTSSHVFYAATSSSTSNEVGRIAGTGDFISPGTIYGRLPGGALYSAAAATFTPSTIAFTKIPISTISSSLNQFTMPLINKLQYSGTTSSPIVVNVTINATISTSSALSTIMGIAIAQNGTAISYTPMFVTSTIAGNYYFISANAFISMSMNDYIEAFATSTNTSTMTVQSLTMSVAAV